MRLRLHLLVLCLIILFVVYNMASYQHRQTALDVKARPFETITESHVAGAKVSSRARVKMSERADASRIGFLPRGIVEPYSDMELKPLWLTKSVQSQRSTQNERCLIAIPAGINQKKSVDAIMKKFLPENFTAILFHYDGKVNEWNDLPWSKSVIHVAASNQTKWYLNIVKSEKLVISQPGLDPKLSEIHHPITVRKKAGSFHRVSRANKECSREGPPCSGWVEGMAPVFSKSAWQCAWHLIQNDLVHGWGIDYKFGYCAQGDRTKNIGIVDSEFVVHRGVQTLGGSAMTKNTRAKNSKALRQKTAQGQQQTRVRAAGLDMRTKVRRKSRVELRDFQKRWERATREDRTWVDPFARRRKRRNRPAVD
ncbi:uncharacterized protein [Lolium perenne]|uniref:uncharacterized protein isoform X4 n=1 Tax=Lolium perenne TaxID=4522 RepID=UPI0021F52CA3|nr:uncharacterized protein LOC127333047 isoform X4 [Lolium perenne]